MILGFDIGNTHIVPVFYSNNGEIKTSFRIPSNLPFTEDTLFSTLKTLADNNDIDIYAVSDIIVSSVVPHINEIFEYLGQSYFKIQPKFVSLDTVNDEIKLLDGMERGLGADRIVDILAAKKLYPDKELLIIDFGTATTFDMIKNSIYMGGCILPGIELSINTLFNNTAKLPKIKFSKPDTVFGTDTVTQINAGIFYGNVGAVKELIFQYKKEMPAAYIISTGGQGKKISEHILPVDEYIPKLGEIGIFEFYKLHKGAK
ncbi:type III pantothenate kinase [Leptotrichia sp. OH3620_COT-345]|uniref:type III pantothenate kinase n=1 Tax=Leptotrichia sp. OH3620_COT-345 TaxID=2491048 RepID=UPI000F65390B|nr:type III pantothenate kinase [Leptotrichia sp. OH3620_COT-345]RRD40449.1 type III pantothenate kinase [Leptotrichia sp. OH3620_COT-345]